MNWIDTHCHLYDETFISDFEMVIKTAIESGISKIYLPAIDSSSHAAMLSLESKLPSLCNAMMGLHPCYVKENYLQELAIVEQYLVDGKFCAIGEIGLDFYWDKTFADEQLTVFTTQMQWAIDANIPIVIHSRNATQETLNAVKPFASKGLRGIFHCFSGSLETAKQIIDLGFLLGIGGVITYKNAGIKEVVKHISLSNIVLETDAPYLSPVPFRGKRNEPGYIPIIARHIADAKEIDIDEVAAITTENAINIFG